MASFVGAAICAWVLLTEAHGLAIVLCVAASWCFIGAGLMFTLWGCYGEFCEVQAGIVIAHGHHPAYRLPAQYFRAPHVSRISMPDMWMSASNVSERWSLTIMDEVGRTATLYFDTNVHRQYPVSSYYPTHDD
jgi:hypothetical protein